MAKRKTLAKKERKNRKTRNRHLPIKMKGGLIKSKSLIVNPDSRKFIEYDLTHYYQTLISLSGKGRITYKFRFLEINEDYCIIEVVFAGDNDKYLLLELNKYFEKNGLRNYKILTNPFSVPGPRASVLGWGSYAHKGKIAETWGFWELMKENEFIRSSDAVQAARAAHFIKPNTSKFTSSYQQYVNDDLSRYDD